ncbi:MAG: hypothetical protein M3024_05670 [Candidatus Dormibacteraeota bacterium]|nr:hypothetical protein [Candidatus Dormibacteraeota bacterium]
MKTDAEARPAPVAYRPPLRATWWLQSGGYLRYMVREFTAIPIALWMVLFLVQIGRSRSGPGGYQAFGGPLWIGFSLVVLVFALWHSLTFLSFAGLILRIPMGSRTVPAGAIATVSFGALAVASIVIGFLLIQGGR